MFETKVDGAKLSACVPEPILPSHVRVRGACLCSTFDRNGFARHPIISCCYTLLLDSEACDMPRRVPPCDISGVLSRMRRLDLISW